MNPFCDRIVPRSENDDNHDRFALHRVNKLRGLRYWSPTELRGTHPGEPVDLLPTRADEIVVVVIEKNRRKTGRILLNR